MAIERIKVGSTEHEIMASGLTDESAEKIKLNGIAEGAEVNQNAFSNVVVGSTTIAANSKTATLKLVADSNVTLTPDAAKGEIKIAATDTTYTSLKNPYSLTIQGNGTTLTNGTYDGSAAKTVNITASSIGAAASSHGTHVTWSTTTPKAAGTAAVGSETKVARGDHVHPLQTTVSGNAGSATKLQTARTIDGVSFDGSAAIVHYGTCSTAAGTAAKTVACTGFTLVTGASIKVRFTVTNTAAVADLTLNVNSTGAKGIKYRNANLSSAGYLAANRTYEFVYDGTYYQLIGDLDTNTINYGIVQCSTAAGTAAKVGSTNKYSLANNRYMIVVIQYANSVAGAITLNINSAGAKPIYINGSASSSSNYTLPAGTYIVYYNGTNYYFRTDSYLNANISGTASGLSTTLATSKGGTGYTSITDTTYTTARYRASALVSTATAPTVNGVVNWVYE